MSTGHGYACALRESGEVVCWGENPEHRAVVGIEGDFAAVGQGRLAGPLEHQSQLPATSEGGRVRNPVKPVSITVSSCRTSPTGPCREQGYDGLVGGVDHALDHSALRQGRPPK